MVLGNLTWRQMVSSKSIFLWLFLKRIELPKSLKFKVFIYTNIKGTGFVHILLRHILSSPAHLKNKHLISKVNSKIFIHKCLKNMENKLYNQFKQFKNLGNVWSLDFQIVFRDFCPFKVKLDGDTKKLVPL